MLLGGLIKNISITSKTVTTSASGNASINFGSNVVVLSAWALRIDTCVLPYPSIRGDVEKGSDVWWFHIITDDSSYNCVVNTSVTLRVAYYVA